jgi:hypothetical protein
VRTASLALFALFSANVAGCDKPAPGSATASSSAPLVASAPPAATTAAEPALPAAAPPDLDVGTLKKKLGCTGDTRRQACRILNEFGDAARFSPQIPSGEGRWIGNAYTLEKAAEKSELMVVSASQVPTSQVPAGELALKIGIGPMPDDKRVHAMKLVNALSHGDTVSKLNQAAAYVKTWKPADARGTMATSGSSVRSVTDELYLRQSSTKILLVRVKPQSAGGASAETTLAELWPAAW